jgi:beta-mannosidase
MCRLPDGKDGPMTPQSCATSHRPAGPTCRVGVLEVTDWALQLLSPPVEVPVEVRAALSRPLPVRVPGSVHGALIAAGLIRDIAVDGLEAEAAWIGRASWRCTTTVQPPPGWSAAGGDRAVLEFWGIDTVGTVSVGGVPRLHTLDMHRRYDLDVSSELGAGPVEVAVDLSPASVVADDAEATDPLPRPSAYRQPYNQVRKMACSFGWDWGPSTTTEGLWRPVRLRLWRRARLTDVRVAATLAGGPRVRISATVELAAVEPSTAGAAGLALRATVSPTSTSTATATATVTATNWQGLTADLDLEVPQAQPWFPVGLGDQPLYDLHTEVLDAATGEVLEASVRRIGFRDVVLVQAPDPDGTGRSFELHVNDARVWVRGLNWIPDDPFPERVDATRVRTRIGQAVDAGANLLRVWGGGVFESEDFYDACDAAGVLVWQDFLFACAAYPEDPGTAGQVAAEAADNVRRLRHRASLALWCGGNENLWGFEEWGWQQALNGRPWGSGYYHRLLPDTVVALDGSRPYIPGSPFSPEASPEPSTEASTDAPTSIERLPANAQDAGCTHIWDVWNDLDYTEYERRQPRFAAEFGYQAPASWPTLVTAVLAQGGPATLLADDERLEPHQKADDGRRKLYAGLVRHLPQVPVDGPGWYFATQLLQARAVSTGIGHFRSLHDRCSGTVWWQLNDCWPAVSWSVIDVAGRRKLAWYALRAAYQPQLAVFGGDRQGARLTLVNDTGAAWRTTAEVSAWTRSGAERGRSTVEVEVPAHGHRVLPVEANTPDTDLLVADLDGRRATRWLRPDVELWLPAAELDVRATALGPDQVRVDLCCGGLLRDVALLAELELPDALVDEQLLTLLPGERASFTVRGSRAAEISSSRWRDVLWHDARLS